MIVAVDAFAGPGGWDVAARRLGIDPLGIEIDAATVATRTAAGLRTLTVDVARVEPRAHRCDLFIASPPCPSFSQANDDRSVGDVDLVRRYLRGMLHGDTFARESIEAKVADPRSLLTAEPLRWALLARPRWIALEQVPPVLPIWRETAELLHEVGYSTWCGILEAERYGVPQTRERAFLMAELDSAGVHPPPVTHQRHAPGHSAQGELTLLDGELKPFVTMAEALGWGLTARPAPTVPAAGTSGGGPRPLDGGSGARAMIREERAAGRWKLRAGNQENATERSMNEPAPTIAFGHNSARHQWVHERPATTVQGDPRIWPPGHKRNAEDEAAGRTHYGDRAGTEAIRVEPWEAGVLQGFPADYPWQGSRTAQFAQIGNAVPPPLAEAVLRTLLPAKTLHPDAIDPPGWIVDACEAVR